jgi:hypothetical protein
MVGSLRYYPSDYTRALDEWYFGPEVRYRHYASQYTATGTFTPLKEYRNLLDIKLSGGYINYISDNVIIDIYGGVGIRSKSTAVADNTNTTSYSIKTTSELLPCISLGFKIGFGF